MRDGKQRKGEERVRERMNVQTDSGQTFYKNRLLMHNLQQPDQTPTSLVAMNSPGSQPTTSQDL